MSIIIREAESAVDAMTVADAFDQHDIRIVAINPPTKNKWWLVWGQCEGERDFNAVDRWIERARGEQDET